MNRSGPSRRCRRSCVSRSAPSTSGDTAAPDLAHRRLAGTCVTTPPRSAPGCKGRPPDMAVDDRWYLSKRDPKTKKPLPSKRHGRGKRWRVRYTDAAGQDRERLFELKRDADDFDARCRVGVAPEVMTGQADRRVTFTEYAERWRLAREVGWTTETRRRIPRNISKHLVPVFGAKPYRSITLTDVLAWLSTRIEAGTPKSSLSLYFSLFKTITNAAVIDKVIPDNPCDGV